MGSQKGFDTGPAVLIHRLCRAVNDHDLEGLVACFDPGYRNETPAHPERGFVGTEQVRRNWSQIFAAIPDLQADVVDVAVEGDKVWSEWEHRGTRKDGSEHLMRGVVIFGIEGGRAAWARFFLEPVQHGHGSVDDAVRTQVEGGASR